MAILLRGQQLAASQRTAEAVTALERAREGYLRHLGSQNQNVLLADLELAEAYLTQGRTDDSNAAMANAEQAMARDHVGDRAVTTMVEVTRKNLAKLKAGEPLHRCGT